MNNEDNFKSIDYKASNNINNFIEQRSINAKRRQSMRGIPIGFFRPSGKAAIVLYYYH